jgi:hypothetical protein
MNPIDEIKQRMEKYPQARCESDSSSVTVFPITADGFEVTLIVNSIDNYTVHFEGWHEDFNDAKEALNCFAFGLSTNCRLREYRRGNFAYKWTVEHREENEWLEEGTVGLLLVPFWRRRTSRLLQNNLIRIGDVR